MSIPIRPAPQSDDHIEISEVRAKGGRNLGLIWILVASLLGAALALGVVWTIFSGPLTSEDKSPRQNPQAAAAPQIRPTAAGSPHAAAFP